MLGSESGVNGGWKSYFRSSSRNLTGSSIVWRVVYLYYFQAVCDLVGGLNPPGSKLFINDLTHSTSSRWEEVQAEQKERDAQVVHRY